MSLTSLIYVSSAQVPFSNIELTKLLETARRNNTLIDVTGMLVYRDGNFMQVIEGEEEAIRGLHEKIRCDPRHGHLITLLEKTHHGTSVPRLEHGFPQPVGPGLAGHTRL